MGLFGGVKGQRGTQGGVYIDPGAFLLRVNQVKTFGTRQNAGAFCVETTILECSKLATQGKHKLHVGGDVSWMVTDDKEPFLGNVNDYCCAANSILLDEPVDADDIDEEDVEFIVGEQNPHAGLIIGCVGYNKPTKKGKDFTRVKWMTADEVRVKIKEAGAATKPEEKDEKAA